MLSRHPRLYEINTRVYLARLARRLGRPVTLGSVPASEWRHLAELGFDLVWLMGVWRRSPGSRAKALGEAGLRAAYAEALPGWSDADVAGSPYAIHAYRLDPALGGEHELAQARAALAREGVGLILDFVPNHLAIDHPWTREHPERFVEGSEALRAAHPEWFFPVEVAGQAGGPATTRWLAHGRDPYFPPWYDTAQLDHGSRELREALAEELLGIGEQADGARCDMAMLALNEVFARVWGEARGGAPLPATELWSDVIGRVRARRPGFLLLAEAYWGLEGELRRLGFDHTYDKGLYDLLLHADWGRAREHLAARAACGGHCVHFLENHDERRAAAAFGPERLRGLATALATLPGVRLFHDGQLEGRRVRLPVQLVREPEEAEDPALRAFHEELLALTRDPLWRDGEWAPVIVEPEGWDAEAARPLLAWGWTLGERRAITVLNLSNGPARGRLPLPGPASVPRRARDLLAGGAAPEPEAREWLHVALPPWGARIVEPA